MPAVNIYHQYHGARQFKTNIKGLKRDIDISTIILGDFNIELSSMNRSTEKKSTKKQQH